MSVIITAEAGEYARAVQDAMRRMRKSLPEALRFEGRQVGKALIRFTPPQSRAQGRAAVKRDIHRAVGPVSPKGFQSERIKSLLRKRNYPLLNEVFARFKSGQFAGKKVVPFDRSLHTRARDSRGRVSRDQRRLTPDVGKLGAHVREKQALVGQGKGAWSKMVTRLGGTVPEWIRKHEAAGDFTDRSNAASPFIKIENHSAWASRGDDDRVVANTIKARVRDIRVNLARAQERAAIAAGLK